MHKPSANRFPTSRQNTSSDDPLHTNADAPLHTSTDDPLHEAVVKFDAWRQQLARARGERKKKNLQLRQRTLPLEALEPGETVLNENPILSHCR